MITNEFLGREVSRLGFGTMRLPLRADGSVNEEETARMIAFAMEHGINYFDTAFPYHGGMSEIVVGRNLKAYPRENYCLASKFPGHQIAETYDPSEIFEKQLKKCGVDYFDYYLLHNVYERSAEVYLDPKWGIVDYFREQKRLGRIRHLGFSAHGRADCLRRFLDATGDAMEFCQIQLNYLDWTLQDAKEKYELLTGRGLPIIVMEPLRGGRLARLTEKERAALPDGGDPVSLAFRWLISKPGVKVILSGMSSFEQMRQNEAVFSEGKPLTGEEEEMLLALAERMKNAVPCTGCRYCTDGCPAKLPIPTLIASYNDLKFGLEGALTASMQLDALPADARPENCIGCGSCTDACPQKIDVRSVLADLNAMLPDLPHWEKICAERAAAAKRLEETQGGAG